jgi:prephenate dehydratase
MRVAFQGIVGSFHHEAAEKLLGSDIEPLHCKTFQEVFAAVKSGGAERGVVAVENSLHGSINAVYRLLSRESAWVCGELILQVEQYLIGASPDLALGDIKTVMSQPPALAQCEQWLETNLPEAHLEETYDTAESVRYVTAHVDEPLAAIAGKRAAELYGGKVLAGPINDDKHNYTRFFLLSKDKTVPRDANKTSIILETNHEPGALYRALGSFADAGINLSKLDSHPIAGDKQHYAFYIDFEVSLDEHFHHPILDTLQQQDCKVTVLGCYPAADGVS